jgi:large subunit ribosomal protein L2
LFLKLINLQKTFFTSAASRTAYFFFNKLNFQNKIKKFTFSKKWNSGRNDSGRIVVRTKSSLLRKNKIININYNLRYLRLGFVSSFQFIPFKNKLLSLIFFSNGCFTYYISNDNFKLFSFIHYNFFKKLKKIKNKNFIFMLFQIKKLSFISNIELLPGKNSQYTRSPGTKSRIIKFDNENQTVFVQLSSGVKKIFSYYSVCMLNAISMSDHSKCTNGKAGYWRTFGIKSLVRGVAMNPVDHPHGGRTKSVKYPRTPWGKTTKFK